MDDGRAVTVTLEESIAAIDAAGWDAIANPCARTHNPFLRHDFLTALEITGCVGSDSGWWPRPLVMRDASGSLLGAMPGYLKAHSQGEYVFDHAWADALHRAGGEYYPKWVAAVPFTPVTGPRFLHSAPELRAPMMHAVKALPDELGISSAHILFATPQEASEGQAQGLLKRQDVQFHWVSEGYRSFDDFLGALASRKRKDLRKERARAQEGLTFAWKVGDDITSADLDAFFAFYQDTGARKWGRPYLNRAFFEEVHARMGEEMALVLAMDGPTAIAGALNFIGGEALYGRYWGRREERPFLHFETCYYQAIDFALRHNLTRVEAGAQGGHKLARGYAPVTTYSLHAIGHPGLRAAVADYLEQERSAINRESLALREVLPFRKG